MTFYRRNLPHWHPEGKAIFLTWRLCGSLPAGLARRTAKSSGATARSTLLNRTALRTTAKGGRATGSIRGEEFAVLDRYLDSARTGPRWLADPEIAAYAEEAVLRGAELGHYVLYAYVIMPNHVHVLLYPWISLPRITGTIKGVSARDANATLGRTGKAFWQDESFDHWVRNSMEFERIQHYIEWNPVKAGLAAKPEDWRWSSAHPEVAKVMARVSRLAQPRVAVPPTPLLRA